MIQKYRFFVVGLVVVYLGLPASTRADGFDDWIVQWFANKFLDGVVDQVTNGKAPDARLLDRRLKELEDNAMMRGEMREEIRRLRDSVNKGATRAELKAMAERVGGEIVSIKRRLDSLEERVERLEVENDDLKTGTKNAASAAMFSKRGDRFASEKNVERAFANYNIASKIDPKCAAACKGRCAIYIRMGAWGAIDADITQFFSRFERGLHNFLDPLTGDVWFERTRAIVKGKIWNLRPYFLTNEEYRDRDVKSEKQYEEAAHDCSTTLMNNPSDIEIWMLWGSLRLDRATREKKLLILGADRKGLEEAKELFDEAIRLDPTNAVAFCARGFVYAMIPSTDKLVGGHSQEARADYAQAIRLNPRLKDAYILRANLIVDLKSSIPDLTMALEIDPNDVAVLEKRAVLYTGDNRDAGEDYGKAISDYLRILELQPNHEHANYMLGIIYYNVGDKVKASRYSARADELKEAREKGR